MALATHCIPYDEECSICNPPTSQAVTPTEPPTKCWTCGAPVVVTKGSDNGLQGADKIASSDSFAFVPPVVPSTTHPAAEEPPELKEAPVTLSCLAYQNLLNEAASVSEWQRLHALECEARNALSSQLERLKAEQEEARCSGFEQGMSHEAAIQGGQALTAKEIAMLLDMPYHHGYNRHCYCVECEDLRAKLQRCLSQSPEGK